MDFSAIDRRHLGHHPGYVASTVVDHDPRLEQPLSDAVASRITEAQTIATFSRAVDAIASTPVGVVLTFNYDTLLEEAARARGRAAHALAIADIPALINDHLHEPDGALRVVHLHGVADDPGSLVLVHAAYMRQAGESQVRELFAALMARHNLCAIGTQFEEDYLATIMLARRPSRPRHVLVCDLDLAQRVLDDDGRGLGADRHHWLPCSHAVGEYAVLDEFCEHLVTCDEVPTPAGPTVGLLVVPRDTAYASRRLVARDEVDPDTELSAEVQLLFGDLRAHDETALEQEQLSILIGSPGSGKTRLLQEMAGRDRVGERAVMVRLRDLRQFVGEPEPLLRAWLGHAGVVTGDPLAIDDALTGRQRLWLLLDGLDEVPLAYRNAAANAVERLAQAYPQHRFLVTARPIPSIAGIADTWRTFELLCDEQWQTEFLGANAVTAEELSDALGPAAPRLRSLLKVPFFLRGAVRLVRDGTAVTDAMQIALDLLDQALDADEQLTLLGAAPRRLLARVALLQQVNGFTTISHAALVALAAEENLGDPSFVADLLSARSLLAMSADGDWAFEHRLFGEALAAEQLASDHPEAWIDAVAPRVDGWSAVVHHWSATLQMLSSRSLEWRQAIAERDSRFAARSTPIEAPAGERMRAASALWRRATELDVWIDPMRRDIEMITDGEIVAELMRPGEVEALEIEVRDAINGPTRFVRGNAVDVLSMIPVADIADLLGYVLKHDSDSVVRRSAASAAHRLELCELAEVLIDRAKSPADEAEAGDMASVALHLCAPESKLEVATSLVEAGNRKVRDYMVLEGAPVADRVAWLTTRAKQEHGRSYSLVRELSDLITEVDAEVDEPLTEEIGYLAALLETRDADVAEFIAGAPASARGIVRALTEGDVAVWEVASLLEAAGEDALRDAGAADEVLANVAARRVARTSSADSADHGLDDEDPEATSPTGLRAILQLPVAERNAELVRHVRLNRTVVNELSESETETLRQTLDEWWDARDLREAVDVVGQSATIGAWATVVLSLGPTVQLWLSDDRWVQVATCKWLFEPQYKWLGAQATQPRFDRASDEAADSMHALSDLLYVSDGLDTDRVVAHFVELGDALEVDVGHARAADALFRAGDRDGLEALASVSDKWRAELGTRLAALGNVDAQVSELRELAARLRAGEHPDRFGTEWLAGISDPVTLDALEEVLVAAGQHRSPEAYPDITAPVVNAVARLGDSTAVSFLDRIARERPYPGAQFLVEDRDRLIQFLLEPRAREAGLARGKELGLPSVETAS